jgi:uncharacterized cupin superfamily protein
MANGITVTSNPDPAQLQSLGVTSWPTWGCGVSTFPWTYDEQETGDFQERCHSLAAFQAAWINGSA